MAEKFLIDEQTLRDLQLRDFSNRTIFSFYEEAVITEGGQEFFLSVFYDPVLDIDIIKNRQSKIRRLEAVAHEVFPFYRVILKDIEKFIKTRHSGGSTSNGLMDIFGIRTPAYYYKKRNIFEVCDFLMDSQKFYQKIYDHTPDEDLKEMIDTIDSCLARIFDGKPRDPEKIKINIFNIDKFDRLIRFELSSRIKRAISFFYEIDAYFAVAKVSEARSFCYPEVYPKNQTGEIYMEGVYHIFHKSPVKNDLKISKDKKLWFLTGANMAGKSSIIKTISSALYLTHIGFPVPADQIKTDLIDGLFTSINLQDNLEMGYSHFYVEAMRLKDIVDQLEPHSNALMILDELFKGTNHSDASNAILKVMKNLAEVDGPFVIVSSHITELSEELKKINTVDFFKMNIESDPEGLPIFTYKIVPGIAEEKLGMWLLKKSGAFESIDKLKDPKAPEIS
ncbi:MULTISPECIES: MutS-related protein [Sphingobacterium]|uniref:DNA mismatch repair proteins mutS family domain-containing protein n=1 Tax=Sphingobacterium tenebrionis TaxID=3111775 RepID=A0ABU8I5I7_9SPHI|nr:hypothetical protein [Sphingobacterium sp. CZ-2]QBR11636.1 hypothetical protein E3D81_05395 [Sphingobacterium sp. CZ-2]